jgi:hypothetical protein
MGWSYEQLAMVSVVQREWAAKNPRATFKAPITVEDVLNSRMIAYPFRKWPAPSAAMLMHNKHPGNCHIRVVCGCVNNKPGPGNMMANLILAEGTCF